MTHTDRYGNTLSTTSDAAAAHYRDGMDRVLAAWSGAAEAFDAAIAADPAFALAHLARARVHATYGESAAAIAKTTQARQLVAPNGTDREHSHVDALALGVEGKPHLSLPAVLRHVEHWPRDALVLAAPLGAFGLFAFSGMSDHDQARVDLCERYTHHYGGDWWFQSYLGWSHTENGNVAYGRRVTEHALSLRRENANAVHALAHAMFEDGSADEAETLITGWLPTYERSGLLFGHLAWHQTLVALEQDDPARALAIYLERIQPSASKAFPLNIMTDGAALLWRLKLHGHDTPAAAVAELSAYGQGLYPRAGNAFVDVHMCLLAAAAGDRAALETRVHEIEARLADARLPAGPVVPAICRAALNFADGDYRACAERLAPLANEVVRIGGSHAQREVVEDMLLVAWMRCGEVAKAGALLDTRLHRRPSPRDSRWQVGLAGGHA